MITNKIFLAIGIEALTKILQVVLIVLVVGAAGFFIYMKFMKKKGKTDADVSEEEIKSGKILDTSEFVPVEDIREFEIEKDRRFGVAKLKDEDRYIASLNCKGFDIHIAVEEEVLATQVGYFGFINTIQNPITLRIDSSAADLANNIKRYQKIRQNKMEERDTKYNQFLEFRDRLKKIPDGPEKRTYESALVTLAGQIDVLTKSIDHIASLINYEIKLSGRNANPIQEERYIIDWEFNPNDFPANITEAEIWKKAAHELWSKYKSMKEALSAANVRSELDSEKGMFQLNYRHFHPFAGDLYKEFDGTNANGGISSGRIDFEEAKRKYQKALESEEWKAAEERMRAQREATLNENVADEELLDEDDDDAVLGSGVGTIEEKTSSVKRNEGGVSF